MRKFLVLTTIAAVALPFATALAGETASNPDARAYFVNLEDGASISSPFTVVFGLSGMGVAPAGTEKEMTGHHHLLIDRPPLGQGQDGAEEIDLALPNDDHHKHFGGGQTETTLDLPSGQHTLQLVLGDYTHVPHNPPILSDVITITVE